MTGIPIVSRRGSKVAVECGIGPDHSYRYTLSEEERDRVATDDAYADTIAQEVLRRTNRRYGIDPGVPHGPLAAKIQRCARKAREHAARQDEKKKQRAQQPQRDPARDIGLEPDRYFDRRLLEARRGDTEAAKDLLYHIEEALATDTAISRGAVLYLRLAIRRILDGNNPKGAVVPPEVVARALLLANPPHRRKGAGVKIDDLSLAAYYQRCLNQGHSAGEAKNEAASEYDVGPRTIERVYEEYREAMEALSDIELDAILDDKK